MLYFHCTAKLAKAARLKLEPAPDQDALHWLHRWYANIIPLGRKSELIFFTNASSLFTILVPQPAGKVTFFAAVAKFRRKLGVALSEAKMDPKKVAAFTERDAPYITCKTASRSVLGSMNDLALSIPAYRFPQDFEGETDNVDNVQSLLNEVPHSPLGYQFPIERFRELVSGGSMSSEAIDDIDPIN